MKKHTIDVVLKITERCNINCSYCYMFNMGNDDFKKNPKYISFETIERIGVFLYEGIEENNITGLNIILHGGEPLLLGKERFTKLCQHFLSKLGARTKLTLSLQTNAMLVDEDWINIFQEFNIEIGISLDGPQEYNDISRIDHNGNGTYERVLKGIAKLKKAAAEKRIRSPGALIVINPDFSAKKIHNHIVNELNFASVNFLLPMVTHDSPANNDGEKTAFYLKELAEVYVSGGHKKARIRIIDQFTNFIAGVPQYSQIDERTIHNVIAISSKGGLDVDDEYKTIQGKVSQFSVHNSSLRDFLVSDYFQYFEKIKTSIPEPCLDCCWQNFCAGGVGVGAALGRYSSQKAFNNKSVHCNSLREFYSILTSFLLAGGLPRSRLDENLFADRGLSVSQSDTKRVIRITSQAA